MAAVKTLVSEAKYLASMTGEKPALEFVNGEVFEKPLPMRPHNDVTKNFTTAFVSHTAAYGGYWTWEATTNLSADADRRYRVPDFAFWAAGRRIDSAGVYEPPTVAVEVRSEGQSMPELRAKCAEYLVAGVDLCWLVDPERRTVEVVARGAPARTLRSGDMLTSPSLPGFSLPVEQLWRAG